MKQIQSKLLSATLLVALMAVSASVPAFAHGSDDTSGQTSTTDTRKSQAAEKSAKLAEQRQEAAAKAAELKTEQQEAKAKVQAAHEEAKADGKKGRTDDQRKKICNAHKDSLNTKVKRLVTSSENTQKRIDSIFAKAQAFQNNKNLQPADYDSLLASAQAAQTESSDAVAALKAATPTIDCSNGHAADDAKAFKATAKQAREKLHAYRASVKALLKSLQTANKATKTEGSQG